MLLSQSNRCLLGAILVKIGSALLLSWGKTNVYFYSYYKETEPQLSIAYNTLPLAIVAIPAAILTIFSVKIAKKIGYELLIRLACFFQCIALLIVPYMPTYLTFIICYIGIYGLGYSIAAFPIFTCTWSHYKKSEGRVSGILLGAFGLATVCFVILITYITNPQNLQADLQLEQNQQVYKYFSWSVANNVPKALQIVGYIAAFCCLFGGFLIKKHNIEQPYSQVQIAEQKIQKDQNNELNQDVQEKSVQIELQNDQNEQEIESSGGGTEDQIQQQDEIAQITVTPSLTFAMRSSQFIIIICCQSVLTLFLFTLGINYKSYVLSKINEDFFITFVDLLALLSSAFANVIWGILIDKVNFKILFALIYFVSGLGAIFIPLFSSNKILFLTVYVATMMFDKGALVVIGPGLIKIFGDELGHQLFPLIQLGSVFSMILGPISQFVLLKYITFDIILYGQGSLILLVIILILKLNMNYSH